MLQSFTNPEQRLGNLKSLCQAVLPDHRFGWVNVFTWPCSKYARTCVFDIIATTMPLALLLISDTFSAATHYCRDDIQYTKTVNLQVYHAIAD